MSRQTSNQPDPDSLFFTPAEIGSNLVRFAEDVHTNPGHGIRWGVPSLDRHILPVRSGKILFILARPGHGKSSTAAYLARRKADEIKDSDNDKRIVVYITLDQPVEEVEAIIQADAGFSVTDIAWGRADLEQMRRRAISRVELPLWLMGKSVVSDKPQPRLTYPNIYAALRSIKQKYGKQLAMVVLDYLQAFRIDGKRDRTSEVNEATFQARELSLDEKVPLVVCVQAGRGTDVRERKLPTLADCQWASAIEQEGDAIVSIWRPVLTEREGATVKGVVAGSRVELPVTQELFVMQLIKQRMSPAGGTFYLYFDPSLVRLADLELRTNDRGEN